MKSADVLSVHTVRGWRAPIIEETLGRVAWSDEHELPPHRALADDDRQAAEQAARRMRAKAARRYFPKF